MKTLIKLVIAAFVFCTWFGPGFYGQTTAYFLSPNEEEAEAEPVEAVPA